MAPPSPGPQALGRRELEGIADLETIVAGVIYLGARTVRTALGDRQSACQGALPS